MVNTSFPPFPKSEIAVEVAELTTKVSKPAPPARESAPALPVLMVSIPAAPVKESPKLASSAPRIVTPAADENAEVIVFVSALPPAVPRSLVESIFVIPAA
jgi:hypothetical protein